MNQDKTIQVWKPVNFNTEWQNADTSKLDDLLPSWYRKREEMQTGGDDFEEFINRLKRQHAIETGVIEKLYDLSEGITQTFIKEGFVSCLFRTWRYKYRTQKINGSFKRPF